MTFQCYTGTKVTCSFYATGTPVTPIPAPVAPMGTLVAAPSLAKAEFLDPATILDVTITPTPGICASVLNPQYKPPTAASPPFFGVCAPMATPWKVGAKTVLIGGKFALNMTSTSTCTTGKGIIAIFPVPKAGYAPTVKIPP